MNGVLIDRCFVGVPSEPTNVTVSYVIGQPLSVRLEWQGPTNTGLGTGNVDQPITKYFITANGQAGVTLAGNTSYYLYTGLIAGVNYIFSVAAGNVAGLGQPTNVTKIAIGSRNL